MDPRDTELVHFNKLLADIEVLLLPPEEQYVSDGEVVDAISDAIQTFKIRARVRQTMRLSTGMESE
jgi:hypothetical protein